MDFIINNSSVFITLGAVLFVLLIGFVFIPFLKKNGNVKESDVELTAQILKMIQLIVSELEFDNDKNKEDVLLIVNVCEQVTGFIKNNMKDKSIEEQKQIAEMTIKQILKRLDIKLTDNKIGIIETFLDSAYAIK